MPKYVATLPPITTGNPAQRELLVDVNGTQTVMNPALDAVESERFAGEPGQSVHMELVDIDSSGNRSLPSAFDAQLLDTMAPPQPGQLGIRQVED